MSITVRKIIEANEIYYLAEVQYERQLFDIKVIGNYDYVQDNLDVPIQVEFDYEEVLSFSIDTHFEDSASYIRNGNGNDEYFVSARISNIISSEKDTIIDLYMMNSAEFISILGSELIGYKPCLNDSLNLNIKGLTMYPVSY